MASDLEGQISSGESNNPTITGAAPVGNSTHADHGNPPPPDYLKHFISVAVVIIFLIPAGLVLHNTVLNMYSSQKIENIYSILKSSSFLIVLCIIPYLMMVVLCYFQLGGYVKQAPRSSEGIAGIYYKSRMTPSVLDRIFMVSSKLLARTGLLISWAVVVILLVPRFKSKPLLGSPLWKWSLLAFTIPAAYFVAMYLCMIVFQIIRTILKIIRMKGNLYLLIMLYPNTMLVLYFGIFLGLWVGYFRTERGLNHFSFPHPEAFNHVTWICISLFVGSILWFVKAYMLMLWSTGAIYRRFEPRILMTTVKFLYLGLIAGDFRTPGVVGKMKLVEEYILHSASQDYSFQKYIMSKHVDTYYLYQVCLYLMSLAKNVKPLEEEGLPRLHHYFAEKIPGTSDMCEPVDLVDLIYCLDLSDEKLKKRTRKHPLQSQCDISPGEYRNNIANVLYRLVREQCSSASENQFTFDDLKKWMVDAHVSCVNMGRTLEDAFAIVTRLDWIISILIFSIVVLMWLLISGIATTAVLVAIATPLLALTFVFGDSAKMFFQGILYCFGTHSVDVGDRCILDDTELEVEKIGIMTTQFIKIGSKERRLYPNAVLATKAIINKGWEPDPSDTVVLKLDMSTFEKEWEALETKLERFFKADQQKEVFGSSYEVTMEEIDDKIKVIINFKHVLNVKEMTHSQCFLKKKRQRSMILKCITKSPETSQPTRNGDGATPVNSPAGGCT